MDRKTAEEPKNQGQDRFVSRHVAITHIYEVANKNQGMDESHPPAFSDLTESKSDLLDGNVAEHDIVAMACKAEEAFCQILAGVWRIGHEFRDFIEVSVQDDGTVELYLDGFAFDGHFLIIPLASRTQKASGGWYHSIG